MVPSLCVYSMQKHTPYCRGVDGWIQKVLLRCKTICKRKELWRVSEICSFTQGVSLAQWLEHVMTTEGLSLSPSWIFGSFVFFFSLSILSIVISISCHYLSSRICYSQTRDNELVLSASSTSPHPPVYQTERPYERSWTANHSVGTWRMSTQNWGEWL